MRRAAKVDRNQSEIVHALRQVGASVQILSAVGAGCPDLLVGYDHLNWLLEVKDGEAVPSARKLTSDQVEFHATWRGQVCVVKGVMEALTAIGALRGQIS